MIKIIIGWIKSWFVKVDNNSPSFLLEENDESDLMCIRIKGGEFSGVVFCFRKVSFEEPKTKDMPLTLKFEYDILECANKELLESKISEFETMLGDYLITILDEGNKELESKRTHNPIFATDERNIYEEDSSVSSD